MNRYYTFQDFLVMVRVLETYGVKTTKEALAGRWRSVVEQVDKVTTRPDAGLIVCGFLLHSYGIVIENLDQEELLESRIAEARIKTGNLGLGPPQQVDDDN